MKKYAIVGSTIIDGTGVAPVEDGTVLVEDGKITAAGRAEDVQVPHDVTSIDARGKFTMPGISGMCFNPANRVSIRKFSCSIAMPKPKRP